MDDSSLYAPSVTIDPDWPFPSVTDLMDWMEVQYGGRGARRRMFVDYPGWLMYYASIKADEDATPTTPPTQTRNSPPPPECH